MTSEERRSSENASGEAASSEERRDEDGFSLTIADHEAETREREDDATPDPDAILGEELDVETDPDDEEAEPVELLVQLAESGEIEPWDIDIVRVTDKFLDALDEADLRTSGRALFYASVLLRMKSDAMLSDDDEEEPEESWDDWEPGMDAPMPDDPEGDRPAYDPVASLEAEMDRRMERKTARGTPETLDELVRELRERERDSWWKDSRSYDTTDSPSGFDRGTQTLDYRPDDAMRVDDEPTADETLGNAHDEDIEAVIDDVREELSTHYDAGREEVLYAEVETAGGTRIETFLAVLFLSHRGVVTLDQDEMFGDLWVVDADAEDDVETPAIAD
ncbi:segregation and condensation protein A [Halorussus halobius]|uniref:segregation and condensation protein A n=1 Tax=Halorussus halobius TaxID=1710537 RepID=UPI001091CDB6|nr:ScpA family protein [Halorussus halobius]